MKKTTDLKNIMTKVKKIPGTIFFKLFISMVSLVAILIVGLFMANNYFFETFYRTKKADSMIECLLYISENFIDGNISDISADLTALANKTGATIEIKDMNGKPIYPVYSITFEDGTIDNGFYIININYDQFTNISTFSRKEWTFYIDYNEVLKAEYLSYQALYSQSYYVSIRIPITSISENVSISNQFVIMVGAILIFMALLFAFFVAKIITKPITNISQITKKIANFDFSSACDTSSKDEVGDLARNINYLSSNLNQAFIELKEKNAQLQKDIEKERKIDEMRKTFVANVSHELRTPISVILGYSEGLISNIAESKEDINFYCGVISDEAIKMNKLVADLLDLSQIEADAYQLVKKKIDIVASINYIVSKYKQILYEKDVTIIFEPSTDYYGYFDELRFEQVVTNYLTNAIDHVDNERIIQISIEEIKNNYRIGIFNTGNQIPEESIEQVWTNFYKVDKARTRSFGGHGIGLSIVKGIQESHQQTYGCYNKENGVYFYFDIDIYKQEALTDTETGL